MKMITNAIFILSNRYFFSYFLPTQCICIHGFHYIQNNTFFFSHIIFEGIDTQKYSVENIEISLSCDYKKFDEFSQYVYHYKISKFVMIETYLKDKKYIFELLAYFVLAIETLNKLRK